MLCELVCKETSSISRFINSSGVSTILGMVLEKVKEIRKDIPKAELDAAKPERAPKIPVFHGGNVSA